jgi:protein involved in polysaccharide export with SLBB domain
MKFGEGWSSGHERRMKGVRPLSLLKRLSLGLFLSLLVGCASGPPRLDQVLMADKGATGRNRGVEQAYHVFCPDVLQISIDPDEQQTASNRANRATRRVSVPSVGSCSIPSNGTYAIDADGRINLGPLGKVRIEGQSPPQIVNLLANEIGISADRIHVKVAECNSQQIYLYGQVMPESGGLAKGCQRAVAYRGPETVLDLLRRVGGITPGAASNDVNVVRSRLADNQPPLVFHIDLQAIVMNQDQSTNLRLQPFDQVFVGEAKKSSLEKCLPPFVRPMYEKLCGMRRPGSFSYDDPSAMQSLKANLAARTSPIHPATARGADDE